MSARLTTCFAAIVAIICAGVGVSPAIAQEPTSSAARIAMLEAETTRLRAELAAARATDPAPGAADWGQSAMEPRADPGSWRPPRPHPGLRPPASPIEYWTWSLAAVPVHGCPCTCPAWTAPWSLFPTSP